eukprot:maker-scaffold_4-snap-gene-0.4-mRNA-1 protein AED:0.16 eAED:0.16 QI:32/1/1/1/1/1/2/81/574
MQEKNVTSRFKKLQEDLQLIGYNDEFDVSSLDLVSKLFKDLCLAIENKSQLPSSNQSPEKVVTKEAKEQFIDEINSTIVTVPSVKNFKEEETKLSLKSLKESSLKKSLEELNKKFIKVLNDKKNLQKKVEELNILAAKPPEPLDFPESDLEKTLKKTLEEKDNQIGKLKSDLFAVKSDHSAAYGEFSDYKNKLQGYQKANETLQKEKDDLLLTNYQLKNKCSDVFASMEEKDRKVKSLKAKIKEKDSIIAEYKDKLSIFQKAGEAATADMKILVEESTNKAKKLSILEDQLKELEKINTVLNGEISLKKESIKKLKMRNTDLVLTYRRACEENKKAKEYCTKMQSLNQALKEKLKIKEKEFYLAKEFMNRLEEGNKRQISNVKEKNKEVNLLKGKYKELHKQYVDLMEKEVEVKKEAKGLRMMQQAVSQEHRWTKLQLSEKEGVIQSLQQQVKELDARKIVMKGENERLKGKVYKLEEKIAQLRARDAENYRRRLKSSLDLDAESKEGKVGAKTSSSIVSDKKEKSSFLSLTEGAIEQQCEQLEHIISQQGEVIKNLELKTAVPNILDSKSGYV